MNEKWQKGIEDLKKINLSREEKSFLLQRILTRSPYASIPSNIFTRSFVAVRTHAFVTLVALLVLATGGVSYAAESSLPGDLLYPLKVDITEPIRDIVQILPEQKVEWEAQKANRRIEEVEALISKEKFDEDKKQKVEILFTKHTERFVRNAEKEIEKEAKKSVSEEDAFETKTRKKSDIGNKSHGSNATSTDMQAEKINTEVWSKIEKQNEEIAKEQKKIAEENEKRRSEIEKEVKERIEKAREDIDKRIRTLKENKEKAYKKSEKSKSESSEKSKDD